MNEESNALASRARAGDPTALEELARRHYGRLRLYVRSRLGPALARRVDAEDLVQESFLRAFRDLDRFVASEPGAFHHWLTTVARHAIADAARAARALKRGRRTERLARSDWSQTGSHKNDVAASTLGPATRALLGEEQQKIEAAFAALPPHYRRVIALRQFEQRPAREVAGILGSTEQAVHALYRRALSAWGEAAERP